MISTAHAFLTTGFVDWLEKRQLPCFYKSVFGLECPGCGIQRAIIALLQGDLSGSFKLYPALLPLIAMFVFLIAHIFYQFKNGAKILTLLFVFNVTVIAIAYLCKFIV